MHGHNFVGINGVPVLSMMVCRGFKGAGKQSQKGSVTVLRERSSKIPCTGQYSRKAVAGSNPARVSHCTSIKPIMRSVEKKFKKFKKCRTSEADERRVRTREEHPSLGVLQSVEKVRNPKAPTFEPLENCSTCVEQHREESRFCA